MTTTKVSSLREQIVASLANNGINTEIFSSPELVSVGQVITDEIMSLVTTFIEAAEIDRAIAEMAHFQPIAETWVEKHHSYLGVNYLNSRLKGLQAQKAVLEGK